MVKRLTAILLPLLFLTSCVHAQQGGLGGTGLSGGTGAWQAHITPPLVITRSALPDVVVGTAYNQTLTAKHGVTPYSWTILLGALPDGLIINSSTGAITGTPTTVGNFLFTVLVTDSTSPTNLTATKDFSIAVTCTPLSIVSDPTLPVARVGTAYSFQFNSSGGQGSVTWAQAGLTDFSLSAGGAVTGTPTLAQTQSFTVTATDSCPITAQTATQTATLTTNSNVQIVTPSSLPDGVAGDAYSVQFAAQGGTAPYTWTVASGSLPDGLSLSSGGALTGTPTVAGTFSFVLQATDTLSVSDTAPFTVVITCDPLSVTTATLPGGHQGTVYSSQLTSTGGYSTLTWSASGLPNGLTISGDGLISGTPTASGTFSVIVSVTDSCSTPQTATATLSLSISSGLTISTSPTLPNGTVGVPYTANMTATGGTLPYQWTVPSGPFTPGAQDIIDWMSMKLPDRLTFHLSGGATPKYVKVDAGVLWLIKSANGTPSDIRIYDKDFLYQVYTDNNDANQQAACQLAGYSSCFVDPFAYKQIVTPRPFTPRYFVPGTTITIMVPPTLTGGGHVNPYIKTTNCGVDNQPIAYLGNVKVVTTNGLTMPPGIATWGGDVGAQATIEVDYYYSGSSTGVYVNRERFYFVRDWGWVSWDHATLQSGVYVVDQGSTNNLKVAGGAPTPNFGCKIPNLSSALGLVGALPPGVTSVAAPELNMASNTGIISGTPTQKGTTIFTVQVEDAVGTITQQVESLTIGCPAFSLASTSPIPLATNGVPYSFQFSSLGGVAPISWLRIIGTGNLPTGLTLSSTGRLSGTPTQTGVFNFIVQATDSCIPAPTQSVQSNFQLTVQANNSPLSITTPSPLPAGTESVAYSAQIVAAGGRTPYTFARTSGTLPTGLSLSSTGLITGTPTTAGTFTFTIRVTDALASTASKSFTLIVSCPTQSITSTSPLAAGTVNKAYSFQFASTGGVGTKTWSRTAGAFPTGMSLSSSGLLSGTPTVSGSFSFTIRLTDSCSPTPQTTSVPFTLVINPAPVALSITTASLPNGTEGVVYSTQLGATGGTTPYTWTILSGSLPTGLSLSSAGVISGTPTQAGSFTVVYKVTDNVAAIATRSLILLINCPTVLITSPTPLPVGEQANVYTNFQFTSSGGILPITWSVASGAFPTGLSMNSSGLLSGTPTANGSFTIGIRATDSCAPTPSIANKTFSLSVVPALTIATTSPLSAGIEGQVYSATVSATGGTIPYVWSISTGSLPTGLTMSAAGVISGTPTTTGVFSFTVRVTDAVSATTTKALSITITCPAISITTGATLPVANQNQPYSFQFTSLGGVLPITWTGTSIPTGLSLSTTGALTGTPTGSGAASLSITATDSCLAVNQTANGSFSLTTTAAPAPLVITSTSPLPAGTQGVPYSTSMAETGGVPPYTWARTAGSLPAGLSIASTGVISGTPTTIGTATSTLRVTDSAAVTASGSFAITISCVPLAITSSLTLPTGTQSSAYSTQLTSSGGTSAKTWSLVSGSFPTGVSLSSAGLISGTPSTSGSFSPQIRVTDSCSTPQTATSTFSLTINPAVVPVQITTATPLPTGTVSTAYSVTLSATGGTPPYGSWTVTVGTLPTGLTLHSATGIIDGTPSVAGSSSFTIRVADNVAATATKAFTLVVNAASAADNRYCSAASVVTNLPADGPVTQPLTACVNTAIANTPSPGAVVNVTSGSCSSLQAAVAAAVAGVTIKVPPATYSCAITLAASGNAANWITLETSSTSNLPAEGSRISPAWIGIPSLHLACPSPSTNTECGRPTYSQPTAAGTYLPTLVSNGPTIIITGNFWRLIGLHPTTTNGVNAAQVIQQQTAGTHIILDRMVINGGNSPTGQDRDNIQAAVRFIGCASCAVIDSYLYDTHCVAGAAGTCVDSQAIDPGGAAASLDGPIKIVNNFLETSGESILTGGGGVGTTTLPATNLEIRRNHMFKPLFWKSNDPSYYGTNLEIKNCMEYKNTVHSLIEGNIFEKAWAGQSDQHGVCVLLDSRNQSSSYTGVASASGNTLTWVSGTQFKSSIVSTSCPAGGCHVTFNGTACVATSFISVTQITVDCPGGGGGGTGGAANWQKITTPATATNISNLAFDSSNNWYISDVSNGAWKSTDQATSWTAINSGLPNLNVQTLQVNPANDDIIAGLWNVAFPTAGPVHFYRSTNAGTSWSLISEPALFHMSFSPAIGGCLLPISPNTHLDCGGYFGSASTTAWYSTNGGTSTSLISQGTNSTVYSFFWNPITLDSWMGTETQGVFRSTDAQTFASVSPGSGTIRDGNIFGISYDSSGNILFVSQGGIWKCPNSASTHTCSSPVNVKNNPNVSAGWSIFHDSSNALYYGHQSDPLNITSVFRSLDDGTSWQAWDTGIPTQSKVVQFQQNSFDGMLYAVIPSGIYRTSTGATQGNQPPQVSNAAFTAAAPGLNPAANDQYIVVRYNQISHVATGLQISNPTSDNGDLSLGGSFFSLHDNSFDDVDGGRWGQGCCNYGFVFQIQNFEGGVSALHDISIWHNTGLATYSTGTSAGNGAGAAATGNQTISGSSIGNFRLYDNILTAGWITGSANICGGTTTAESLWTCWTPAAQLCFDNNFMAIATTPSSGTGSFSRNNPPYPTGADNGYCPYGAPLGNTLPTNFTTYQFTNLNGANGGNYQLQAGSPYHNLASDGTDPGVRWTTLQTAIAGVQ